MPQRADIGGNVSQVPTFANFPWRKWWVANQEDGANVRQGFLPCGPGPFESKTKKNAMRCQLKSATETLDQKQ